MKDGVIPSPNIWDSPEAYELENRAFDPDGLVWAAIRAVRSWDGADVLDIGCGSGYHLPFFARTARTVLGVEPHPPLVALARSRVDSVARSPAGAVARSRADSGVTHSSPGPTARDSMITEAPMVTTSSLIIGQPSPVIKESGVIKESSARVSVLRGTAQSLPVPGSSVDVAHARWAYFFGPGCEPGLRELDRVMRRGGVAFIVDNDATRSTFGSWFARWLPGYDPAAVERFWSRHGFTRVPILTRWEFASPEDLARVVRIEFSPEHAERALAELEPGTTRVDYAVNLFWRRY